MSRILEQSSSNAREPEKNPQVPWAEDKKEEYTVYKYIQKSSYMYIYLQEKWGKDVLTVDTDDALR